MATMYMLTETSPFMMSFVIVTDKDNCIIVDGGRPEDMPLLKKYVGNRKIKAWVLTHAHDDHILGFIDEMEKNGGADFDVEHIYYNFPCYEELINKKDVPDYEYLCAELNEVLPQFNAVRSKFIDKEHITSQGEVLQIDEVKIEFLFSYHDGLYANLMNDSSLVFKLSTPTVSVLFLGDLGPEAGDLLLRESRDKLKADIVQMAHHGHMNVSMEVYAEIGAKACLWCCPKWLYEEKEIPDWMTKDWVDKAPFCRNRMYGTAVTRKWMELLGVKTHYVTGDGTQVISLD